MERILIIEDAPRTPRAGADRAKTPFVIRALSFIRHLSFVIRHSSFVIEHLWNAF
jgi:hypothetical protein